MITSETNSDPSNQMQEEHSQAGSNRTYREGPSNGETILDEDLNQNNYEDENKPNPSQKAQNREPQPSKKKLFLIVDVAENDPTIWTAAGTNKILDSLKVNYKKRPLKVGDYAWLMSNENGEEVTLPYIVERKRYDDLSKSVIDGRYHKQKFYMRYSGFPKLIYVIEGCKDTHIALSSNTLLQAACSTMVSKGFVVKFTKDYRDTLFTLTAIGKRLYRKYGMGSLMPFEGKKVTTDPKTEPGPGQSQENSQLLKELEESLTASKKINIKQMMLKQLMCIKGVTVESAETIASNFPTPQSIIDVSTEDLYSRCSAQTGNNRSVNLRLCRLVSNFFNQL